jgi:S1-C subfamily serine protease
VQDLQLKSTDGAIVSDVTLGSPAFKAGVKTYDVITGINGNSVKNKDELVTEIQKHKVGDKLTLNIIRDGKAMDISVTVGDMNTNTYLQQQQQQQQQQQSQP